MWYEIYCSRVVIFYRVPTYCFKKVGKDFILNMTVKIETVQKSLSNLKKTLHRTALISSSADLDGSG